MTQGVREHDMARFPSVCGLHRFLVEKENKIMNKLWTLLDVIYVVITADESIIRIFINPNLHNSNRFFKVR